MCESHRYFMTNKYCGNINQREMMRCVLGDNYAMPYM